MRVYINILFLIFISFFIQTISEAKVIKFKNCKSTFNKYYEVRTNDFISKGFIKGNLNKKILYNIINETEKINFIIDTEKKTLIENYSFSKIKRDIIKGYDYAISLFQIELNRDLIGKWEYNYKIQGKNVITVLDEDESNGYKIFVFYYFLKEGFVERYRFKDEKKKLIESYSCKSDYSKNNGGISSGTAFFVSNKGHLLTNNHVVEGCSISKITYKNKDYDTKLLATDKTLDLALLKAEVRPKSFFNFTKDEVKKLNKVYVAGYPLGKGLSDDLKISSGIVSSLKGFEDNSNEIQIDAPINPGNSGGPIVNENGDLIAIAVSGLAKDQTEGINFGIKSSAAETFLRSNKINPKKSMYAGIKDNDKLLEILEEGTVYTYCN